MTANPKEVRITRVLEIIRTSIANSTPIPTTSEMAERLSYDPSTVRDYINILVERRLIKIRLEGRYRFITDRYTGKEQPVGTRVLNSRAYKAKSKPARVVEEKPKLRSSILRQPREPRRPWTPEEIAAVARGVEEGRTAKQVAAEIGRLPEPIQQRMWAYRLKLKALQPEVVPPRVERDPCGACGTRLDAPIELACAKCRAYRNLAA